MNRDYDSPTKFVPTFAGTGTNHVAYITGSPRVFNVDSSVVIKIAVSGM